MRIVQRWTLTNQCVLSPRDKQKISTTLGPAVLVVSATCLKWASVKLNEKAITSTRKWHYFRESSIPLLINSKQDPSHVHCSPRCQELYLFFFSYPAKLAFLSICTFPTNCYGPPHQRDAQCSWKCDSRQSGFHYSSAQFFLEIRYYDLKVMFQIHFLVFIKSTHPPLASMESKWASHHLIRNHKHGQRQFSPTLSNKNHLRAFLNCRFPEPKTFFSTADATNSYNTHTQWKATSL